MFVYTDWVSAVNAKVAYNAGWSYIALVGVIILVGVLQLLLQTILPLKQKLKTLLFRGKKVTLTK